MELNLIKENEDGSADFTLVTTREEVEALVSLGLMTVLKRAIEEGEGYVPSKLSMGDTKCGAPNCKDGTGEQSCESGQCSYCDKSS